MSISIFKYLNYREFLRDAYQQRHAEDWHFSHRYIASMIKMDASMFSKILQGSRDLTPRLIDAFANLFCIHLAEKEYFKNLVYFNQAKTHSESRFYLERLVESKDFEVHPLLRDQFEYFDKWYHAVLRELLVLVENQADFRAMASMVEPPLTVSQVKKSIILLERLSLIQKNKKGRFEQSQGFISSGFDSHKTEVNQYIQQNLKIATTALERFSNQERNLSTLVFSCDKKTYGEVVKMMRDFRKEVLRKVQNSKQTDRIYQLGMQFFPMSKGLENEGHSKGKERKIRRSKSGIKETKNV
jgi:uncharacterized protein (TIGR02147 family)